MFSFPRLSKYAVIVITPFQYLCALEYLYENKISFSECELILISHSEKLVSQIIAIGFVSDFFSLSTPMVGNYSIKRRLWNTYLLLKRNLNNPLILGNLNNNWCIYLIQNTKSRSMPVILDDGAATIPQITNRSKNNFSVPKPSWKTRIGLFQNIFLNTSKVVKKKLTFYTIFDSLKRNSFDEVIVNDFNRLKKMYGIGDKTHIGREVWFIASPFVKLKMISEKDYRRLVEKVVLFAKSSSLHFKYFGFKLGDDVHFENVEIVQNKEPFEFSYLKATTKPRYIFGFYSTALFALSKMNIPSQLKSIEIEENIRLKGNWEDVDNVYSIIKMNKNIKLININDVSYNK